MTPNKAIVFEKVPLGAQLVLLRLRPSSPLAFKAGQFVVIHLPPDPQGEPGAKPPKGFYSIASAEQDTHELELVIEHRAGYASGWMSTRRGGDTLRLEGPLGKFGLSRLARPQAFLGFKAGIAPLRAMILSLLRSGAPEPVDLYLGEPELLFDADWRALAAAHPQFRYHPSADPAAAFLATRPDRVDVYCAGFNREIEPMLAALDAAGFDKTLVKTEKFG